MTLANTIIALLTVTGCAVRHEGERVSMDRDTWTTKTIFTLGHLDIVVCEHVDVVEGDWITLHVINVETETRPSYRSDVLAGTEVDAATLRAVVLSGTANVRAAEKRGTFEREYPRFSGLWMASIYRADSDARIEQDYRRPPIK